MSPTVINFWARIPLFDEEIKNWAPPPILLPLVVIEADTINATLEVWGVEYNPVTLSKNPKVFPEIVLNEFNKIYWVGV